MPDAGAAFLPSSAMTRRSGIALRLLPLPVVLLIAILAATAYGAVPVPFKETLEIILANLGLPRPHAAWSPGDEAIIWSLRLPRVLAVALVGAALGVAGTLFQAVLRNPLADPYVIGTAAGAQLGVTAVLLSGATYTALGFGPLQGAAFLGALLAVATVYGLARTNGRTPVVTLLLAGFVLSSFLISATSFLAVANQRMQEILQWTLGNVAVTGWSQLAAALPIVVAGAALSWLWAPRLDVLLMGEESAGYLGIRVERMKILAVIIAALLTGIAVTLSGIVPFVGLVIPHAARLLYGPAHRILIPTAALGGALFLVIADLAGRLIVAPTEIPLGIMAAILGAPFFLHLLRRTRRDYGL